MSIISKNIKPALKAALKQVLGITIFIMPILIIMAFFPEAMNRLKDYITVHTWFFRFIRWGLVLICLLGFNPLLKVLKNGKLITNDAYGFWRNKRWTLVLWLVVFEIVVCENIFLKIIEVISA